MRMFHSPLLFIHIRLKPVLRIAEMAPLVVTLVSCQGSTLSPSDGPVTHNPWLDARVEVKLQDGQVPLQDYQIHNDGDNLTWKDGTIRRDLGSIVQDSALVRDTRLPIDGTGWDGKNAVDTKISFPGTWVQIPAGNFMMGSNKYESCHQKNENQHPVTLTHSFEMQSTEVTQEQFRQFYNLLDPGHDTSPVHSVRWDHAASYCNWLSSLKGLPLCYECAERRVLPSCSIGEKMFFCDEALSYRGNAIYQCSGYRLPTDAEWEYAYRATTTQALYNGDITECDYEDPKADLIGWYASNAQKQTHPAAKKEPNGWKLFDLAGNVSEWVNDMYQEDLGSTAVTNPGGPLITKIMNPCYRPLRVYRGGSWLSTPSKLRAASREFSSSSVWSEDRGFRCVRTLF